MTIQHVGIIGAGTMGNGIAQACAVAGLPVTMVDISDAAVQKGVATIAGSFDRLIKKDKLTAADKQAALARITTSTDYASLADADIVIEAANSSRARRRTVRFSRPTRRRSRSLSLPPWSPSRPNSSACTSSTRCR